MRLPARFRPYRPLAVAAFFSLALHATLVTGVRVEIPAFNSEPAAELCARLVPAPAAKAPEPPPVAAAPAVPAQKAAAPKPRRKPKPSPVPPIETVPPAPETTDTLAEAAPAGAVEQPPAPEPQQIAAVDPQPAPTGMGDGEGGSQWMPARSIPPSRVEIHFNVLWDGARVGEATYLLEHRDLRYNLSARTKGFGLFSWIDRLKIQQSSQGEITPAGLKPDSYSERQGESSVATGSLNFDWPAKSVGVVNRAGETRSVPLPADAQDFASFLFQFAFAVPRTTHLEMPIVSVKGVNTYNVEVVAEEYLDMPWGRVNTWHVRRPRAAGENQMDVWLSIDHNYLPVRIRRDDRRGPIEFVAMDLAAEAAN